MQVWDPVKEDRKVTKRKLNSVFQIGPQCCISFVVLIRLDFVSKKKYKFQYNMLWHSCPWTSKEKFCLGMFQE